MGMEYVHALMPAILLLLLGVFAIAITRPLRLSPIVGYLIAGMAIGPHAFDLIAENRTTHLLAELGVVFLLFDIGLHFTLSSIWEARRDIFGLGPLQIIICGLSFGGLGMVFGLAPEYAMILGGALALSSTAVVVQTLAERGLQSCPVGLSGTAILILQDVCAIFLLVFAASLGGEDTLPGTPGLATTVSLALLKSTLAFIAALVIGRYAIRPLFNLLARTKNEEVFTGMALLLVLATAVATGGAGLSLTLGAFLGGMMISETPYRHVIQTEAKPFRNLLLGFFFITVGMSLDWRIIIDNWAEILVFLAALIAIKVFIVIAAARMIGWSLPGAVQLGFLLAQGSEFVFVIIAMPAIRGALGEDTVGVLILGIAASLALTPGLVAVGNRLAQSLKKRSANPLLSDGATPGARTAPVLVFGMGDIGRSVADALEAHNVPYDAIEMDYNRFLAASVDGYPVAFGDVGDVRMMETLRLSERSAIVITIVRYELSKALKPILHERYPDLVRFVTVDIDKEAERFRALGMFPVTDRSIPRGLDMAATVLRSQHIDDARIEAWMQRQQERGLHASGGSRAEPALA